MPAAPRLLGLLPERGSGASGARPDRPDRAPDWLCPVTSRVGPRRPQGAGAAARAQTERAERRGVVAGRSSRVRHFVAVAIGNGLVQTAPEARSSLESGASCDGVGGP